jgi:hypothetical protein
VAADVRRTYQMFRCPACGAAPATFVSVEGEHTKLGIGSVIIKHCQGCGYIAQFMKQPNRKGACSNDW